MQKKKKKARNKKAEKTGVKLSKSPVTSKTLKKPASSTPIAPLNIWRAFDDVFERFRRDFEEHLFPAPWTTALPLLPDKRVPIVDLEDRGKDYLLKAEMPGFKKEDIEIEVQDNSITISGKAGWKYDKKADIYLQGESM